MAGLKRNSRTNLPSPQPDVAELRKGMVINPLRFGSGLKAEFVEFFNILNHPQF